MEEAQNICPRCQTENMLEAKNCQHCRVNLYWAHQHYAELAALRQVYQLMPNAPTAPFLLETSRRIDTGPTVSWLRRKNSGQP